MKKYIILLLLISLSNVGCAKVNKAQDPTKTAKFTTPTIKITDILKVTKTPIGTKILENAKTDNDSSPTYTQQPTYEDVYEYVELLNNSHCDKTCFWGLTPGNSNRENVVSTLLPIKSFVADDKYYEDNNSIGVVFEDDIRNIIYGVGFTFKDEIVSFISVKIRTGNELNKYPYPYDPKIHNPDYQSVVQPYLPSALYEYYGYPEDIYFRSFKPSTEIWPTQTFIHYPAEGLLVMYLNPTRSFYEDNQICLLDNPVVILWLTDPKEKKSFRGLLISAGSYDHIYSIQEITELTIEEFIGLYLGENEINNCEGRYIKLPGDGYWTPYYIQL